MRRADDLSYHTHRATHELALGLSAATGTASRAHMKLSSLHMERARQLSRIVAPLDLVA